MFERSRNNARRAVVLAQNGARDMGHAQIKPEHLLVGLQQGEGIAAHAMTQAGVGRGSAAGTRRRPVQVSALCQEGRQGALQRRRQEVPRTVATSCLRALGHNYIGTEHIFFGVQRQAEGNDPAP